MKYRYEGLDRAQVDYPDVRVKERLWCCQRFEVLVKDTMSCAGASNAIEEMRRQQEEQFQEGVVSLSVHGDKVFRTSAGYVACADPVYMVLRPMIFMENDMGVFLVMECGLIERADLQMGRHEMMFRESKVAGSA